MWIFFNDCFLSIVHKDCEGDELMVRARRKGDIEKIFPKANVTRYTRSDYLYRAAIKRSLISKALAHETETIGYDNFKSAVADKPYHDALLQTWTAMARLQSPAPYSGAIGFPVAAPHRPAKKAAKKSTTKGKKK